MHNGITNFIISERVLSSLDFPRLGAATASTLTALIRLFLSRCVLFRATTSTFSFLHKSCYSCF